MGQKVFVCVVLQVKKSTSSSLIWWRRGWKPFGLGTIRFLGAPFWPANHLIEAETGHLVSVKPISPLHVPYFRVPYFSGLARTSPEPIEVSVLLFKEMWGALCWAMPVDLGLRWAIRLACRKCSPQTLQAWKDWTTGDFDYDVLKAWRSDFRGKRHTCGGLCFKKTILARAFL